MLSIDRRTAIGSLVGMLGDPASADRESTVVRALRSLTGFTFDYDPAGTPEQKKAAVAAWQKWWEQSKESY
jgi:hypothetical protein